jgi:hypothetical protein
MGSASSTARAESEEQQSRPFSQLLSEREDRNARQLRISRRISRTEGQGNMPPTRRESRRETNMPPYGTFRRQVSAQSVTVQPDTGRAGGNMGRDEVLYEQEERPLVNMEDLGMRDGPITHIAAPIMQRPSYMSRLGSRLLPNSVMSGLLNSGEEGPAEGRALRNGLSTSPESVSPIRRRSRHLGSLSLTSRTASSSMARRQSIRGPFPYGDATRLPDSPTNSSSLDLRATTSGQSEMDDSTWRRRTRLSRVRNSLSGPFSHLFGHPSESMDSVQTPRTPPRRPSRVAFAEDSDYLLPPIVNMGNHLDTDEQPHELDSTEAEVGRLSSSPTPSTRALQAANGIRRLPNAIRARSSRLMRRDDHAPLSRVLQLAAAAIAAQLSGIPGPAMPNVRAIGEDGVDGSLEEFVQTLQHATTQPAAGNAEDGHGSGSTDGSLPPVNFLRVFRFVNNHEAMGSSSGTTSRSGLEDPDERPETEDEGPDGRTVTLVVVGVRSVPSNSTTAEDTAGGLGPSLDTLLSLPIIPSTSILRNHGAGNFLRRPDGRSRFSPRRNSMGGINTSAFPAAYDNQRHQRMHGSQRLPSDAVPMNGSSLPTVLSESPPGPHPPPSTPAEPGLSAYSSGTTTPNRRPSSASAIPPPNLPNLRENPMPRTDLESTAEESAFNTARQRRRSDSEFARHRELGSGAARRNGVVGPDNTPTQGGRSWLIYVVGTNLSEDHPAFATPSLFTDVSIAPSDPSRYLANEVDSESYVRRHAPAFVSSWTRQTTSCLASGRYFSWRDLPPH